MYNSDHFKNGALTEKKNNMKLSQYDTLHIIFMSYSKKIMIYYSSEKLSARDCITWWFTYAKTERQLCYYSPLEGERASFVARQILKKNIILHHLKQQGQIWKQENNLIHAITKTDVSSKILRPWNPKFHSC